MSKINYTIKMLESSFPIKEQIFDYHYQYAVVNKISDFWSDDYHLYLETTLTNFQKAILKIKISENNIINIKYYQQQIDKNRFNDHINKEIRWQKIN